MKKRLGGLLLLTPVLVARQIPGALILSIAILTLVGLFVPGANGKMVTSVPSAIMSWPRWPTSTFMALDGRTMSARARARKQGAVSG